MRGILKAFLSDGVYLTIRHLPGVVFNYYVKYFVRIFVVSNGTFIVNIVTGLYFTQDNCADGLRCKLISTLFQEPEANSRYTR